MALGDIYDGTTTIGMLRAQLLAKGYIAYSPPALGDYKAYMHPLRTRAIVLIGPDSAPCLVYQKRAVENATRRV
ncbi:hypothetical protein [Egbenema bharatensis]|uniref:hypothetical protein n=1 Tax=Egbenema bharatensis TaxID=3463334 RepID=UPI003A8AB88E